MWRKLKFYLFRVGKSVLWRFTLLCCEIFLSRFCVEKNWAKNCVGGEKWQIWGVCRKWNASHLTEVTTDYFSYLGRDWLHISRLVYITSRAGVQVERKKQIQRKDTQHTGQRLGNSTCCNIGVNILERNILTGDTASLAQNFTKTSEIISDSILLNFSSSFDKSICPNCELYF